jgi:hypothetical protein
MPMSIISANATPGKRTFLGWIKAVASKFGTPNELQGIDRDEFEQIARDLNLSTSGLYVLSSKAGLTGDLLKRRLAEFKLSAELVREHHPEVLRDLQRVCGNCTSTRRCASEFEQAIRQGERSDYCPNTQTLRALESEVSNVRQPPCPSILAVDDFKRDKSAVA